MGTFSSDRLVPVAPPSLAPVAEEVADAFRARGFEVDAREGVTGGWLLSLRRGGLFKAVVGLKTALNVAIEPHRDGTHVEARIGIFGQQAIPAAIGFLVFWPVHVMQIAGLVRSAKLDDEALDAVEAALRRHAAAGTRADGYCTACGAALPGEARFCTGCGAAA